MTAPLKHPDMTIVEVALGDRASVENNEVVW